MNRWMIGGFVIGVAAVGLYFAFAEKKSAEQPLAASPEVAAPQPAKPQAATLPDVVDVLDIDPLLDPPPIPRVEAAPPGVVVTALDDEPAVPVQSISAPATIPPAIEVDEADEEGEEGEAAELPADTEAVIPEWVAQLLNIHLLPNPWVGFIDLGQAWEMNQNELELAAPPRAALFLDPDATKYAHLYPESTGIVAWRAYVAQDVWRHEFTDKRFARSGIKLTLTNPLAPLLLNDVVIARHALSELEHEFAQSVTNIKYWIPTPPVENHSVAITTIRRVLALSSVIYQVPNSRLDWYTNWHGNRLLPEAAGYLLTAKEVRDGISAVKSSPVGEQKQIFSFVTGLFGGPGNSPY